MNRREAISKIALIMGGTLTGPTLFAMEHKSSKNPLALSKGTFSLTEMQRKIVAEVAEHIIPKTTTAGAKDAGVPAFIEMMLNDCYHSPDQTSFIEGLIDLEKKNFITQSAAEQIVTLKQVEADTKELMKAYEVKQVKVGDNVDKESMDAKKGVPFWRLIKELTLLGYFTSKVGIEASFVYEPIPTKFEPIKLTKGQKAFQY
jgi:Gluconate 2-dehydrogenase subunit 3